MANNLTQWKPQVTVNGERTSFSSYKEVKNNMMLLLQRSKNNEVFVTRSRRGEWGEWFEYWRMSKIYQQKNDKIVSKPEIFKQGWM
jgi:hypothetical protein